MFADESYYIGLLLLGVWVSEITISLVLRLTRHTARRKPSQEKPFRRPRNPTHQELLALLDCPAEDQIIAGPDGGTFAVGKVETIERVGERQFRVIIRTCLGPAAIDIETSD